MRCASFVVVFGLLALLGMSLAETTLNKPCKDDSECGEHESCSCCMGSFDLTCQPRIERGGECPTFTPCRPKQCELGLSCISKPQKPGSPILLDGPGLCCPAVDCSCPGGHVPVMDDTGCPTCDCKLMEEVEMATACAVAELQGRSNSMYTMTLTNLGDVSSPAGRPMSFTLELTVDETDCLKTSFVIPENGCTPQGRETTYLVDVDVTPWKTPTCSVTGFSIVDEGSGDDSEDESSESTAGSPTDDSDSTPMARETSSSTSTNGPVIGGKSSADLDMLKDAFSCASDDILEQLIDIKKASAEADRRRDRDDEDCDRDGKPRHHKEDDEDEDEDEDDEDDDEDDFEDAQLAGYRVQGGTKQVVAGLKLEMTVEVDWRTEDRLYTDTVQLAILSQPWMENECSVINLAVTDSVMAVVDELPDDDDDDCSWCSKAVMASLIIGGAASAIALIVLIAVLVRRRRNHRVYVVPRGFENPVYVENYPEKLPAKSLDDSLPNSVYA